MNPSAFETKQKNVRRIINYIVTNKEASRVMLAGALGLSTATVTNIVTELIEKGLVYESRQEKSFAGRRTMILKFNGNCRYLISVEISSLQNFKLAVCNMLGKELDSRTIAFDPIVTKSRPEPVVLREIIQIVREYMEAQPQEIREQLYGVGIVVGGMVNNRQTIDAPHFNWKNVNLAMPMQSVLRLPVYAEGITRVKASYEMRFIAPSDKNVLYLNLSSGVGMVNFFNGKMVMGKNGIAGEAGHITLNIHGPKCYCGNCGCFESYCGMDKIMERAAELLTEENSQDVFYDLVVNQKQALTPGLLFQAWEMGSLVVHALLCDVAEYLGAGIASLYNLYDPDCLILSGYLEGQDSFLIENARSEAKRRTINCFSRDIHLIRAHLGRDDIHLAVSAYVLDKFLDELY